MNQEDAMLLKLASKAAGYVVRWYEDTLLCGPTFGIEVESGNPLGFEPWNPLIDDGDALRLAVDLGIELYFEGSEQSESVWANEVMLWTEGNRHFATRKAITMAAAEIGRNQE